MTNLCNTCLRDIQRGVDTYIRADFAIVKVRNSRNINSIKDEQQQYRQDKWKTNFRAV